MRAAQAGYAGVNLHSGGEGYYAPIVGEPDATKLRPEYFGLLLAQFTGATFTGVSLAGEAPGVNVYAARGKDVLLIAMVKKSGDPVQARLHGGITHAAECWKLTAPSLDAKDGVLFARAKTDERLIRAYAAVLWEFVLR